jgi:hypothetical protein
MPINTTGSHQIDQAASEIAGHIRDGRVGSHARWREQEHYDEAERLRNEIIVGTLAQVGLLPPWVPANNGTSQRRWFLTRGYGTDSDIVPLRARCHTGPSGTVVRYASMETAQRAADKLNREQS